eukprot:Nk52_evm23s226 gene=Nk52_evmTU23s226
MHRLLNEYASVEEILAQHVFDWERHQKIDRAYFARHFLRVYLDDLFAQMFLKKKTVASRLAASSSSSSLGNNNTSGGSGESSSTTVANGCRQAISYLAGYFQSVANGYHVAFHRFRFIQASPYNRLAFVRLFDECFSGFAVAGKSKKDSSSTRPKDNKTDNNSGANDHDTKTTMDYDQKEEMKLKYIDLLQFAKMLCLDFPSSLMKLSVTAEVSMVLLSTLPATPNGECDSGACYSLHSVSYEGFITTFKLCFLYREFLEGIKSIMDSLYKHAQDVRVVLDEGAGGSSSELAKKGHRAKGTRWLKRKGNGEKKKSKASSNKEGGSNKTKGGAGSGDEGEEDVSSCEGDEEVEDNNQKVPEDRTTRSRHCNAGWDFSSTDACPHSCQQVRVESFLMTLSLRYKDMDCLKPTLGFVERLVRQASENGSQSVGDHGTSRYRDRKRSTSGTISFLEFLKLFVGDFACLNVYGAQALHHSGPDEGSRSVSDSKICEKKDNHKIFRDLAKRSIHEELEVFLHFSKQSQDAVSEEVDAHVASNFHPSKVGEIPVRSKGNSGNPSNSFNDGNSTNEREHAQFPFCTDSGYRMSIKSLFAYNDNSYLLERPPLEIKEVLNLVKIIVEKNVEGGHNFAGGVGNAASSRPMSASSMASGSQSQKGSTASGGSTRKTKSKRK